MKNVIINESGALAPVSIQKKNLNTIEFITVLQEADAPNRNGRIYPKRVLEEALNSAYVRERIRTKSWLGEINHPLDSSVQRQMTIDITNAGFIIEEFWWEGNLLKARCETCNTAKGRDMMGLIEQGMQVAFSLRAQGNVHKDINGNVVVESPLQICTYDFIVNPSHDKAFIERICEATAQSFFGAFKKDVTPAMLCESASLFETGSLIETETVLTEEKDYTKSYNTSLKKLSEMYVPEEGDELISMNENVTVVKSGNIQKKVLTEDYLVKDIRNKILETSETTLTEGPRFRKVLKHFIRGAKTVGLGVGGAAVGGLLGGVPGIIAGAAAGTAAGAGLHAAEAGLDYADEQGGE